MENTPLPLQISEDLGTLDDQWRGWKLRRGQLWDPQSTTTLGWTPSQVRAMTYWRQQLSALEQELQRVRSETHDLELLIGEHGPAAAAAKIDRRKRREARQLETLARRAPSGFTQATEKAPQRTSHAAAVWSWQFSVPWQAGLPMPVKAIPPATQRDRK